MMKIVSMMIMMILALVCTNNNQFFVQSQAVMDLCTVSTTSMIPSFVNVTPNFFNDWFLYGNMCPFGFVKITDTVTGSLSCKPLDEFLLETVDKKTCSLPPAGDPFYDPNVPYIDEANCVLNYLACSPATLKCTYIETRMINDTCTDRINCHGHITNPFINCFNGKCTFIVENPVLAEGANCPFAPDVDFENMLDKSLTNYTTNTYDNCDSSTYCHLPTEKSSQKKCIKRATDANLFETCGVLSVEDEEGNPTTVYKKCPGGSFCSSVCLPVFSVPHHASDQSSPFHQICSGHLRSVNVDYLTTTNICQNYTTDNCSAVEDCYGGFSLGETSGLNFKPLGLDSVKWPGLSPSRCENSRCLRLFGKQNGESCVDNTDCYSAYCNTTVGVCVTLPSEITCASTFDDPYIPPCPMYSYCGCSSEQRSVCVDFCMSKLTDLISCSMNYGVVSSLYYRHPLQPVLDKLIPIIDIHSSLFSPLNGKCAAPLNAYLNCVYENQVVNSIDARLPSTIINNLRQQLSATTTRSQNTRNLQLVKASSSSMVNMDVGQFISSFNSLFRSNSYIRSIRKLNALQDKTTTLDESKLHVNTVNLLNTTNQSEFVGDYSDLYQIDGTNSVLKMSNQIVVIPYHNLVALIPKFKTSTFSFETLKSARLCTCCDRTVRNLTLRAAKSMVGVVLKHKGSDYQYISAATVTTESLSVTNFEPIMGHDSFLNRNWYSSCDLIVVPPEEVDTMVLSIKNNMYFLDRNETLDPTSISELDNMTASDIVNIFTTNIPTKFKTIPRSVRDATLYSEAAFNKVKAIVEKEIDSVFNGSLSLISSILNTNLSCSSINAMDIKTYHSNLLEIPTLSGVDNSHSAFQASSFDDVFIEFDMTLANMFLSAYNQSNGVRDYVYEGVSNPNCYSSYNQYLGVYHYNNPTKYWDLTYKDAMLFLVIILCLVFYMGLLINYTVLLHNNKAMRRRLFVPFIAPLCIIITCLFFLEPILMGVFKNVGMSLFAIIPVPDYCISLLCSSYIVVTLRFFFLRNLYQLREFAPIKRENKSHSSRMKIYRISSRPEVSFVGSILLSLVLAVVWYGVYYGILYGVVVQRFNRFEWTLQFDASLLSLASQFGFLSVVVMLVFVVDISLNIRTIKEKGLKHYFLFDDPFYLRIDIFSLVAMFVTCIVLILDVFVWGTLVVNRLCLVAFFICSLLLVGGNVMIVDFLTYIRKLKDTCVGDVQPLDDFGKLEAQWEEYLTDINFRWLHRRYANNEFSIENFNLYEDLEKVKSIGTLDLEFVNYLHATYFAPGSPYAINLPSRCYADFANAMGNLTLNPDSVLPLSTFREIQYEVVKNNLDIFQRLILKDEFIKWKETYHFQKEMNVISLSYTTSPSCE